MVNNCVTRQNTSSQLQNLNLHKERALPLFWSCQLVARTLRVIIISNTRPRWAPRYSPSPVRPKQHIPNLLKPNPLAPLDLHRDRLAVSLSLYISRVNLVFSYSGNDYSNTPSRTTFRDHAPFMARKTGSRSSAAASTTNYLTTATAMSSPVHSSTAVYASATANTTGGTAPAEPPSPGHPAPYVEDHLTFVPDFETSASISSTSMARKRVQPKSKNHGRFPCSIPGCYAVANHLSSMCRHKWGHLPQRLLPACRGHLPNGAPCPVRFVCSKLYRTPHRC